MFLDTAPCYVHTAQVNDEISLDSRARPKAKGKAARKMVDVPQNCLTPVGYFAKISLGSSFDQDRVNLLPMFQSLGETFGMNTENYVRKTHVNMLLYYFHCLGPVRGPD